MLHGLHVSRLTFLDLFSPEYVASEIILGEYDREEHDMAVLDCLSGFVRCDKNYD